MKRSGDEEKVLSKKKISWSKNILPGIFLDTSFFVALVNESDRDHKQARALSDRVRNGEFGQPHTSDYVFDESITTALVRTGRVDKAIDLGRIILGYEAQKIPQLAKMVHVDESVFARAWQNISSPRFRGRGLSFTDHTILVQIKDLSIETLASLDSGFDGLISRVF